MLIRDAFWSIIYKICEFQPFWMIFWKFCNKISLFLAIFLEFFGLRNNLTLQEPLYTRNITPILYTERNKKIIFQTSSTCKFASWTWQGKLKQSKFSANRLELARNTTHCLPKFPEVLPLNMPSNIFKREYFGNVFFINQEKKFVQVKISKNSSSQSFDPRPSSKLLLNK